MADKDYKDMSDEELFQEAVTQTAQQYNLDPILAHHVFGQESGYHKKATSGKGAYGITQLMPQTAKGLGVDPKDPIQNIDGGIRYLKEQLDTFGNVEDALRAYNAGPDRVKQSRSFSETNNYVRSILGRIQKNVPGWKPADAINYHYQSEDAGDVSETTQDYIPNVTTAANIPTTSQPIATPVAHRRKTPKQTIVSPNQTHELGQWQNQRDAIEEVFRTAQTDEDKQAAEVMLEQLRRNTVAIGKKYGKFLEAGIGQGNWPYIKAKTGANVAVAEGPPDLGPVVNNPSIMAPPPSANNNPKGFTLAPEVNPNVATIGPDRSGVITKILGALPQMKDAPAQTAKSFINTVAKFPADVAQGFANMAEMSSKAGMPGIPTFLDAMTGGTYTKQLSGAVRDTAANYRSGVDRYFPPSNESGNDVQEFIQKDLGSGAGSLAGFWAANALTGGGAGTSALVGAAVQSAQQQEEAIQRGASPEQIELTKQMGAYIGTTEALGIESVLTKLGGRPMIQRALDILKEGGQEAFQQFLQNVDAKYISNFDPNRSLSEDVTKSGVIGSLLAGGAEGIGYTGHKLQQLQSQQQQNVTAPSVAQPTNLQSLVDEARGMSVKPVQANKLVAVPTENTAAPEKPASTVKPPESNQGVRDLAREYALKQGIDYGSTHGDYVNVDEGRARRIADAFDEMKHEPNNSEVKKSYDALKAETRSQYEFLLENGVKFEPYEGSGEPYKNSADMREDVQKNKHLYFFMTDKAFGEGDQAQDHPLLEDSGVQIGKHRLVYNDLFRAVHDYFGHAKEGYQFGARGEENAWKEHSRMYSDEALPALTAETRGQNSWVNYGKHLRNEEGNIPKKGEEGYIPPQNRPFAQQKAGLLPAEFNQRLRFNTERIADDVTKLHAENGGSTFNPTRGDLSGTKNYSVSIYPERSLILKGNPAIENPAEFKQKISDYAQKNSDLLKDSRNSIGTWYDKDSGKTYVDVSVTIPDKAEAIALREKHNQKAIFDLKNFEEIPTGGTGAALPKKTKHVLINYGTQARDEISPEFQGKGTVIKSEQSKRGGPKKVYAYFQGSKPEAAFGQAGQYERRLENDVALYDIAADPDGIVADVRKKGLKGSNFADAMEHSLKDAGYDGYHNPNYYGNIVTLFTPQKVASSRKLDKRAEVAGEALPEIRQQRESKASKNPALVPYQRDFERAQDRVDMYLNDNKAVPKTAQKELRDARRARDEKIAELSAYAYHKTTTKALASIAKEGMDQGDFTSGKAIDFPGNETIRVKYGDIPKGQVGEYGKGVSWILPGYEQEEGKRITISPDKIEVKKGSEWLPLIEYIKEQKSSSVIDEGVILPSAKRTRKVLTDDKAAAAYFAMRDSESHNPDERTIVAIGKYLETLTKTALPVLNGNVKEDEKVKRAIALGIPDVLTQLNQERDWGMDSGKDWYKVDMRNVEQGAIYLYPELQDPIQMDLFKAFLAITSSGTNPKVNTGAAFGMWEKYKRSGYKEIPAYQDAVNEETGKPVGWTARPIPTAMTAGIMNDMISKIGVEGTVAWLNTKHDLNELDAVKYKGKEFRFNAKTKTTIKQTMGNFIGSRGYGSYIFGPKLGAYYQNLRGNDTELTMDMWWSRSWNRWMGTMMTSAPDTETGVSKPAVQGSPRNDSERFAMTKSLATMKEVLSDKGYNLSESEIQAVLWYKEQQLWKSLGAKVDSYSYTDGIKAEFEKRGLDYEKIFHEGQSAIRPKTIAALSREATQGRPDADRRGSVYGNSEKPVSVQSESSGEVQKRIAKKRSARLISELKVARNIQEQVGDAGVSYVTYGDKGSEQIAPELSLTHPDVGEVTRTGKISDQAGIEVRDKEGRYNYLKNQGTPGYRSLSSYDDWLDNSRWVVKTGRGLQAPRFYVNDNAMMFLTMALDHGKLPEGGIRIVASQGLAVPMNQVRQYTANLLSLASDITYNKAAGGEQVRKLTELAVDIARYASDHRGSAGLIFAQTGTNTSAEMLKGTLRHERFHINQYQFKNGEHFPVDVLYANEDISEDQGNYLEAAITSLEHLGYSHNQLATELGAFLAGGRTNWESLFANPYHHMFPKAGYPKYGVDDIEKAAQGLMEFYVDTLIKHHGLTAENLEAQWPFIDNAMRSVVSNTPTRVGEATAQREALQTEGAKKALDNIMAENGMVWNEETENYQSKQSNAKQSKRIGGSETEGQGSVRANFLKNVPPVNQQNGQQIQTPAERDSLIKTALTLRKAGLLTGVKTAVRNISSNGLSLVLEEVSKVPAAMVDMLVSKYTGERTVTAPDAAEIFRSLNNARPTRAWAEFAAAMKGEQTDVDITGWEGYFKAAEQEIEPQGSQGAALSKLDALKPNTGHPWLDNYINTVFNFQTAQDRVFRLYALRRSLEAQVSAMVTTEIKQGKISKDEFEHRKQEVLKGQNIDPDLGTHMAISSIEDAEFALFQNKNPLIDNFVTKPISAMLKSDEKAVRIAGEFLNTVLEQVMPFRKTPANVIGRTIAYTPLGAIPKALVKGKALSQTRSELQTLKDELANAPVPVTTTKPIQGKTSKAVHAVAVEQWENYQRIGQEISDKVFESRKTQKEFAEAIGRGTIGTSLLALGFLMAAKGLMIGIAGDNRKRNVKEAADMPEGGIRLPGTNTYFDIGTQPFGTLLNIGASVYERWKEDAKSNTERAVNAAKIVTKTILEHPLMSTMQQTVQALSDPGKAGEKAGRAGLSQITSFIPAIVKQATQVIDPVKRQATTPKEEFKKNLPFVSKTVPARVDVLGREVRQNLVENLFGIKAKTMNNTPVIRELVDHGVTINKPIRKPEETAGDVINNTKTRGKVIERALEELIQTPQYKAMDQDEQKLSLQSLVKSVNKSKIDLNDSPLVAADGLRVAHNAHIASIKKDAMAGIEGREEYKSLSTKDRDELKKEVNSLYSDYTVRFAEGYKPNALTREVDRSRKSLNSKISDGYFDKQIEKILRRYGKK